ncbi:MAG: hypothetical protein ABR611_00760 [Chthoniobacterales bacterium]
MNAFGKLIRAVAAFLIIGRIVSAASPSITQTEAESLIRSFYHDMERDDLDKIMAHFDQKVQWYDAGPKDRALIADELEKYCATYPSRSFSIGAVKLKPLPSIDGVTVNFDIRFFLRDPARDENQSGRSHVEWDLVKRDGTVRISRFSGTSATEPAASP